MKTDIKEMERIVSSERGKKSWKSRSKGKTKKEISEMMQKLSRNRKSKKLTKILSTSVIK